jgi:hypothetical protein
MVHARRLPDTWKVQKQSLAQRPHRRSGTYNRGTHEQHVERILKVGNRSSRSRVFQRHPCIEFGRGPVKCNHPLIEVRLSPSVEPPARLHLR